MPIDALFLHAAAGELRRKLLGSRVDKIQQPERDVLLLSLRGPEGPGKLLISAGSGTARLHYTTGGRENPAEPPMFCMLLRKHLSGARILSLEQPDFERMYLLRFACLDELGMASEKCLAVEMLGRNANLVLIDGEGRILDCLRKVDAEQSPKRQLLPGLFYQLPPKPEKPGAFQVSREEFLRLYAQAEPTKAGDRWLVETFGGISPLLARELLCRVSGSSDEALGRVEAEALWQALAALREQEMFQPVFLKNGEKPFDLYCFPLQQYGSALSQERWEDFSRLLDAYYTEREKLERQNQRSQNLVKLVKNRRDRASRKLNLRLEERSATAKRETWRQYGDLIKANIYRMKRGEGSLTADNFYDPNGGQVTIPLDVKLSPQQNAARYYKLYTKAKNAEKVLSGQIEEAQAELDYLESVLEELQRAAGERDLAEIRQELVSEGYLREQGGKKKKQASVQPLRYRASTGETILVGRSNLQNDWLTTRYADKRCFWLHVQKTHGAHVILQSEEENPGALEEAAMLAAWYSRGRESSNVPVDYTRVKNVKKPAGAKPGMVIYTDYRTLYVTPAKEAVEALEKF